MFIFKKKSRLRFVRFISSMKGSHKTKASIFRPKNRCVSANMPKKIRVGRSENLFIFLQIFI